MAYHDSTLDLLFHALADPTRRAIVDMLATGPQSVSALAAPHDMALPSFLKHIKVLDEAGLVESEKHGRIRTVSLIQNRLSEGDTWFTSRRRLWATRLDHLGGWLDQQEGKT